MAEFKDGDLERLAALVAHGLSDEQITSALGIDDDTLKLAKHQPAYREAYQKKIIGNYEDEIARVEGWDGLEKKAVDGIAKVLEWNQNPDYLLRVAAISNKAVRMKANVASQTLDATRVGQVVVLQLNQHFVNHLDGQLDLTIARTRELPQKKQIDTPNPRMVERMLLAGTDRELTHARDHEMLDLEAIDELGMNG